MDWGRVKSETVCSNGFKSTRFNFHLWLVQRFDCRLRGAGHCVFPKKVSWFSCTSRAFPGMGQDGQMTILLLSVWDP